MFSVKKLRAREVRLMHSNSPIKISMVLRDSGSHLLLDTPEAEIRRIAI
jgi:hypothetical protein